MPVAIAVIYILLFLTYRSFLEAAHVLLAVPFALTGGLLLALAAWVQTFSVCRVGRLHRASLATAVQTTVVMVIYLEESSPRERKKEHGHAHDPDSCAKAVMEGALLRLRPSS